MNMENVRYSGVYVISRVRYIEVPLYYERYGLKSKEIEDLRHFYLPNIRTVEPRYNVPLI